jgi:hypothetical protein
MKAVGFALALLLIPAAAHAEEGHFGARPKITGLRHGAHTPKAPRAHRAPAVAPTLLHIVPPRAATVLVDDGASVLSQIATTGSILVPTGRSYGITAMRGQRVLWQAQIAASGGRVEIVWSRGPTPTIQQTQPAPLPFPQPLPVGPSPMAGHTFKQLVGVVNNESFESAKLEVIKSAASGNYFSVNQVGRILDELTFDSSKVTALELLRPRILDPENGFLLARHFTFTSTKQQAMAMFSK